MRVLEFILDWYHARGWNCIVVLSLYSIWKFLSEAKKVIIERRVELLSVSNLIVFHIQKALKKKQTYLESLVFLRSLTWWYLKVGDFITRGNILEGFQFDMKVLVWSKKVIIERRVELLSVSKLIVFHIQKLLKKKQTYLESLVFLRSLAWWYLKVGDFITKGNILEGFQFDMKLLFWSRKV